MKVLFQVSLARLGPGRITRFWCCARNPYPASHGYHPNSHLPTSSSWDSISIDTIAPVSRHNALNNNNTSQSHAKPEAAPAWLIRLLAHHKATTYPTPSITEVS